MLTPRKGTKVKIIKDHKTVAICENIGEAARLLYMSPQTVRYHIKNKQPAYNGYKFAKLEAPHA
jgi:DNA-binding CsgD family transcriptional regulator